MSPRRIAVVGSGVSGLVAAHVLSANAEVTLFEAEDRLGGHAHTHDVLLGGEHIAVDTGFIVHNERTYPTLLRLFAELDIQTRPTEMSMSIRSDGEGILYAGGKGFTGLAVDGRSARPRYLRMLLEVSRFHRRARRLLTTSADEQLTLGEFVAAQGFSRDFQEWFLRPLVAAVWSCEPEAADRYPARHLFMFLSHHGMLGVFGSPPWRTVVGGSRTYVEAVAKNLHAVRLGCPVTAVSEDADGVELVATGRVHRFDAIVIATHADAALAMLARPSDRQREVLGAFTYQRNIARLHTDHSVLPSAPRAQASWNYLVPETATTEVIVSYDLTRLQHLPTPDGTRLILTLGGADLIDPDSVIATMEYSHPLFTAEAVAAQRELPAIGTDRIAFAGAYHGWGFHEDGARAGLHAAENLGGSWATTELARMPALYRTVIKHARTEPLTHAFQHTSYTWLVDLDALPDHGPLARFEARDHLGDPARSIRENIDHFLATHGVDLAGGKILMLAQARVFGVCFNPISLFWCHRADGELECVLVEVHNTYGDRHGYLVRPDARGWATTEKAMYVSPFNAVDGEYRLLVPEPAAALGISVTLQREGQPPYVATLRGRAEPASRRAVWRQALRRPWEPLRVIALIRWHGIRLWARRLPVRSRPAHPVQAGTSTRDSEQT